jgi:YspA, cpYpsA-related SLOG family
MRVLVCGGRDFEEWSSVQQLLTEVKPTVVIQGGAPGADRLAAKWADINGVPLVTYPALWTQGEKAGQTRNAFMLADSRPDLVLAFPGGVGTADMVSKAEAAGVPVRRRPNAT